MRESDIERHVIEYARKNGFWCRKFTSPHRRSVPDYILAKHGSVFWIEFKATGAHPTELQFKEHGEMARAGLVVYVVSDRQHGRDIIDSYAHPL